MSKPVNITRHIGAPALKRLLNLFGGDLKCRIRELASEAKPAQSLLLEQGVELRGDPLAQFIAHDIARVTHLSGSHATPTENQAQEGENTDFLWNIDWLCRRGDQIYASGWILKKGFNIKKIELVVHDGESTHRVPVHYGTYRPDVKSNYPFRNAENSGFWTYGDLREGKKIELFLDIECCDGKLERLVIDTEPFVENGGRCYERWGSEHPFQLRAILSHLADSQERGKSLSVFFDHNLGGGANVYRKIMIERRCEENKACLLVYPNVKELCYKIEYWDRDSNVALEFGSLDTLEAILSDLLVDEIFVNNLFSYDDPLHMVEFLDHLTSVCSAKLTIALHDYFVVCPSYKLINHEGRFCGIPPVEQCEKCLANHNGQFKSFANHNDILIWRQGWKSLLHKANTILCYSAAAKNLLLEGHPDLNPMLLKVVPHAVANMPEAKPNLRPEGGLNIGVVGAISYAKGSQMVADLADLVAESGYPVRITVIGTTDREPKSGVLNITGPYDVQNLTQIIEREGVNVFWFPSIWPETFSFVTEELIHLDVPLAVYDIGAPAERVANHHKGLVLAKFDVEYTLTALLEFYASIYGTSKPWAGAVLGIRALFKRT